MTLEYIAEALRPLAVPLTDLHEDPANARTGHDIDMIAGSLRQFGQRKPISVNRAQGNKIEAGNGTYRAAQKLGWSHIAAVFFDDDPATAAAYGIADNRVGEFSKWDPDTLDDVVTSAGELFTGFTTSALGDLLGDGTEENPEKETDQEIKARYMTHVLVSFNVDIAIEVQSILDKLSEINGIELDYGSN